MSIKQETIIDPNTSLAVGFVDYGVATDCQDTLAKNAEDPMFELKTHQSQWMSMQQTLTWFSFVIPGDEIWIKFGGTMGRAA